MVGCYYNTYDRADSRFVPSQWETSLQSNAISHWLGANIESTLILYCTAVPEAEHKPEFQLTKDTPYLPLWARFVVHTMDLLWEKFQWILPLYMKPISFQSKASVVCSVTAAIFIGFCLMKVNVFSQHIGKKTNEYLNSTEQITRNWNVDQLSVLITSWDII